MRKKKGRKRGSSAYSKMLMKKKGKRKKKMSSALWKLIKEQRADRASKSVEQIFDPKSQDIFDRMKRVPGSGFSKC